MLASRIVENLKKQSEKAEGEDKKSLDFAVKAIQKMGLVGWVDVNDRLPSEKGDYFTKTVNGSNVASKFDGECFKSGKRTVAYWFDGTQLYD